MRNCDRRPFRKAGLRGSSNLKTTSFNLCQTSKTRRRRDLVAACPPKYSGLPRGDGSFSARHPGMEVNSTLAWKNPGKSITSVSMDCFSFGMIVFDLSYNIILELQAWHFTGEKHMGLHSVFLGGGGCGDPSTGRVM